jgi:hypothetical protein
MMLQRAWLIAVLVSFAANASAAESLPPFPLVDSSETSLYHRELAKRVYDVRLIADMEQSANWSSSGIVRMSYTEEHRKMWQWPCPDGPPGLSAGRGRPPAVPFASCCIGLGGRRRSWLRGRRPQGPRLTRPALTVGD